jgi:RecA/RadA recombinase
MTTTQRHERIEQVVTAVQQRWGAQALRRLEQVTADRACLPTGNADLDRLLGGGVPRGALLCLSGPSTCGKTTLVLDVLARVQAEGEVTVYIDLGGALDPEYAEGRGVDLERLLIVWPQPLVLGLEIARDLISSGGAGLVVFDAEGTASADGSLAGLSRRLQQLSAALRRSPYALISLTSSVSNSLSAGLMTSADSHVHVERARWLCNASGIDGYEARLTLLKHRFGPPGETATVPIRLRARRLGP